MNSAGSNSCLVFTGLYFSLADTILYTTTIRRGSNDQLCNSKSNLKRNVIIKTSFLVLGLHESTEYHRKYYYLVYVIFLFTLFFTLDFYYFYFNSTALSVTEVSFQKKLLLGLKAKTVGPWQCNTIPHTTPYCLYHSLLIPPKCVQSPSQKGGRECRGVKKQKRTKKER